MGKPIKVRNAAKQHGYGKHLLFFPSRKTQSQLICHSVLESDYCTFLEYDPGVVSYFSQPEALMVTVNGRQCLYQPDFRIETVDKTSYTEVKHNFNEISTRIRSKLQAAKSMLRTQGSELVFADIDSIRAGAKLRNLKFLYFHSFNVSADEFGGCRRLLSMLRYPVTLRSMLHHPHNVRERAIYRAMFEQLLEFDLNERLTLDSRIMGERHEH
ncbi:hypothetical protein [Pseudomonas sp. OA65]|uniref:hypothetical protein n=1 Tax=Pseudomonas sp. OA65 TaxID=2818431 RepID=UPI001A9D2977|nr:hypothetical protein [Pseudomonas sp. OA65]MBO1541254.1 hypothetical protein [Pseudomonas sp. OA65]